MGRRPRRHRRDSALRAAAGGTRSAARSARRPGPDQPYRSHAPADAGAGASRRARRGPDPLCAGGVGQGADEPADRSAALGAARAQLARDRAAARRHGGAAGQGMRISAARQSRSRDRAVRGPRPLLSGARGRGRRAGRADRRHERGDGRAFSQIPRHRGHRHRRRLSAAGGRGAADGAGRGRALSRPAGRRARRPGGERRPAAQSDPGARAIRSAWSSASSRSCACRRSKATSSAC